MMTLILLLAAAAPAAAQQVVPVPPPSTTTDPLNALYLLVGSVVVTQLIGAVVGVVKWLSSRTVEREDKDKESVQNRLDEHEEKSEEQDRTIANVDKVVGGVQAEVKQVLSAVETIKGVMSEIRDAMDKRFEKQSEFYRTALEKMQADYDAKLKAMETQLRHDMQRSIHDAIQMEKMKAVQEKEMREMREWESRPPARRRRSKPSQS